MGSVLADGAGSTGMLYGRNRYYDPGTGQFTQQDPIGIAGGANVYGFAGGDPVIWPNGYMRSETFGGDRERKKMTQLLWNQHQNHLHIAFYTLTERRKAATP